MQEVKGVREERRVNEWWKEDVSRARQKRQQTRSLATDTRSHYRGAWNKVEGDVGVVWLDGSPPRHVIQASKQASKPAEGREVGDKRHSRPKRRGPLASLSLSLSRLFPAPRRASACAFNIVHIPTRPVDHYCKGELGSPLRSTGILCI